MVHGESFCLPLEWEKLWVLQPSSESPPSYSVMRTVAAVAGSVLVDSMTRK